MWFAISLKCILWSFWPLTSHFACVTQGCFCAHGRHDTQSSQGFLALINRWQWCMEHWHVPERQRRKRALASEPRNLKRRKGTSNDFWWRSASQKWKNTLQRVVIFILFHQHVVQSVTLCRRGSCSLINENQYDLPHQTITIISGGVLSFSGVISLSQVIQRKYVCFWCVSPWISHWLQHNRHPSPASNQDSVTYSNDLS